MGYPTNGDIYFNPVFGDLWIVENDKFIKINNGYTIDFNEPEGFIKVGHVDNIVFDKKDD